MPLKILLKNTKKAINNYAYLHWGIRFLNGSFSLGYYRNLKVDLKKIKEQSKSSDLYFPVSNLFPCYEDKKDNAGKFMLHYFYQDLFVAQEIYHNHPQRHIDIGSRIDGFITHVASYREIEVFDIRPLEISVPNIKFTQADLMNLDKTYYECTDSLSCLHALEHFGLGRYGDPISFEGYLMGFKNISLMLKKGGKLYFSVPMGKQRIEFHAHRIFSLKCLLKFVTDNFSIDSFSYINDKNLFFPDINLQNLTDNEIDSNMGCDFGCAIFVLTKN